jgi:hypothetical protein
MTGVKMPTVSKAAAAAPVMTALVFMAKNVAQVPAAGTT